MEQNLMKLLRMAEDARNDRRQLTEKFLQGFLGKVGGLNWEQNLSEDFFKNAQTLLFLAKNFVG